MILDPFCGTGGLLVETGLLGHKTIGFDLNEKMLRMAKINMDYYKIKDYKLKKQDSTKKFEEKFDAIVTDLPYGLSIKIESKELQKLYKDFIENICKIIKKQRIVLITPDFIKIEKLLKNKFKIEEKISYFIHRSLTRKIYVLKKS